MEYTIDIDTGGTFTDGFFVCQDLVEMVKVPTTPHDLTVCFLECIKAGAQRFGVSVEDLLYKTNIIRFSNTIGTNTIIQRDGTKVGLLVTFGKEGLSPTKSNDGKLPLVLPDMVQGIEEEVSKDGEVVKAPDKQLVLSIAQELIDRGARCLVVAFNNSEFNPANERLVRQAIKREYPRDFLGSVPVFLSSDISRRSGDVERINAAVLNAYTHEKLVRLLYKAGEDLRQRLYQKNLFIVHNNGATARVAKTRAINTYNSGPTAGLLGARLIGQLYGVDGIISADMGGTSFDVGSINRGQPSYTLKPDIEGFKINLPMLGIRAIGAGGGSIASVNGSKLQVGPQSAGALPGPVCFDLGGLNPTVTDSDLILGILDPNYFLGGKIKLNTEKARALMEEKIAKPLGISIQQAALEIKKCIDEAMGTEVKRLKQQIGLNQDKLLVIYGGAGPAHCCEIARIAGLKRIVITPFSAVFSAFASSSMDVGHLYYRRVDRPLEEKECFAVVAESLIEMEQEATRDMRGEGFSPDMVLKSVELFVQPEHGGSEMKTSAEISFFRDPTKFKTVVKDAQELLTTTGRTQSGKIILNTVSLMAQAKVPHYEIRETSPTSSGVEQGRKGSRFVFLEESKGLAEVPVYDRGKLGIGHQLLGPALIESEHTTIFASPGWGLKMDRYNHVVMEEISKL